MAENPEGQEKTEEPTPKRLEEARERGQVAKSIDTTSALVLLLGTLTLFLFGDFLAANLKIFFRSIFRIATEVEPANIEQLLDFGHQLLAFLTITILPILLIIFLVAFTGEVAQVGLKIATKKFTEGVDFKKFINPLPGLRRLFFSKRTVVELLKSFFKMGIIMGVMYWVLSGQIELFILLPSLPMTQIASFMFDIAFELTYKVAIAYILIAIGDYAFQKYQHREDLKMTKQEVKDEMKQMEGDVKIKARLRALARERLRKLILQRVKEADVVITNPTHYAVALQYKADTMDAPIVVAKGVDYLALKIIELARSAKVPIVQNPPLAQTLYKLVDIDEMIPESLYRAVAEVLAYVYTQRRAS